MDGVIKRRNKRKKYYNWKYINGTKGMISLFLALIMLPFTTIAGSLVNAARINSAVAIFDEALCNASDSTLGTYDSFLRKRFGLLAMEQQTSDGELSNEAVSKLISETFKEYMKENVKALSNTYISFDSESTGVYSLADTDVLLSQVLEYSKYSVPTKLVEDGLSIESMIGRLEKNIPGKDILNLITAGAGVADNMLTLAEDFAALKTAINDEDTAITNYNNAYDAFSGAVSQYVSKKSEMETELSDLQAKIDEEKEKTDGLVEQIEGITQSISELENEQETDDVDNSEKIEALTTELENLKADNEAVLEAWETAKTNYTTKKTEYETQLTQLLNTIMTNKATYSSCISVLSGKISVVQKKLLAVQKDIANMGTSVVNMGGTVANTIIENESKKNDKSIEELKKDKENAESEEEKKALDEQIEKLKNGKTELKNIGKVVDAQKTGFTKAMDSIKVDIKEFDSSIYSVAIENLNTLKDKVDNEYNTDSIDGYVDKAMYYVEISGRLTYEAVEKAEENLVESCAKSTIWALVKAVIGFIKALFSITLVYDEQLGAVIDSNYYEENYHGLPAEKDRNLYPLSEGAAGDAALSEYYKDLFGDYGAVDTGILGSFDLLSVLESIFEDIGVISTNVSAMTAIYGLFNFASRFKEITDATGRIVENMKSIIMYFGQALSETSIYSKVLLSGYISYMTSDRTTYSGSTLNGGSFNLRGQEPTTILNGNIISGFDTLLTTIQKNIEGGSEKCFVGAEKEYILYGSSSEIANQAAAFGTIYLIRVIADMYKILTNPEVASIAAACTIAAPIVYILYIFIEPLVDTVILVNGGEIDLIKNYVYLTPTGLESLVSHFKELSLTSEQMDNAKIDFKNAIGASDYADVQKAFGTSKDSEESKYWNINYSQNLFLIMTIFSSREKMLDRLSNIIEMEAVENLINNGNSDSQKFDLDYSYTHIRTEASFTTNEFISISENGVGLNAKKRIIYRGY